MAVGLGQEWCVWEGVEEVRRQWGNPGQETQLDDPLSCAEPIVRGATLSFLFAAHTQPAADFARVNYSAPTLTLNGDIQEEEDDDVPLAILQAHNFPGEEQDS